MKLTHLPRRSFLGNLVAGAVVCLGAFALPKALAAAPLHAVPPQPEPPQPLPCPLDGRDHDDLIVREYDAEGRFIRMTVTSRRPTTTTTYTYDVH